MYVYFRQSHDPTLGTNFFVCHRALRGFFEMKAGVRDEF
jgi:hypothetical protein